jgi:NodT family efflux transporter outer membrane factor (OMF) lipoprotein
MLLAPAMLTACSFAPHYNVPETLVPVAYKGIGPWTPAVPQDGSSRGDWWIIFKDPTLDALEKQVPAGNPTLAAALASYDQAQAYADEASASLFPWLSFGGSSTTNRQSEKRPLRSAHQPNEYDANSAALSADYEFDFWGRVRNLVAVGEAEAQASNADLATAQLSIQSQIADTYMNLRGLDAQTELLVNTVAAYQRALDLVQNRHDGGIASGLDVDRAQTQLSVAKAQISDFAAARALYEHAIASLIGEPASNFSLAVAQREIAIPQIPVGVPAALLQRRPDVAAVEREAFAANAGIGVARAAFFPQITLDAAAGFQNTGGTDLIALPYSAWTLGPSLTLPIFEAGRLNARLAAAQAAFREASANYRATVLTAFQQVEDNLSLSNLLAEEAIDQRQAVQSADATERLSLVRYREGVVNYLDVVTAQTAALEAERSDIALETRRERAAVDLIRALGGGWDATDLASGRHEEPPAVSSVTAPNKSGSSGSNG